MNQNQLLAEESLKKNLADNMRSLRHSRKLSQETLARKLGITQKSISKYELAQCLPPAHVIANMAAYFGVSMDMLLTGNSLIKKEDGKTNENFTHSHAKTDFR